MEYLSRILNYVGDLPNFQFYQGCRLLKFCQMCFADDLIMFCGGDYFSMYIMLRGLTTFSMASSLEENKGKSELYGNISDNNTI